MNKSGYVILVAIILALGLYTFYPEALQNGSSEMFSGTKPVAFRLHVGGLTQDVSGKEVHLHDLVRPLVEERATNLWQFFKEPVPKSHVVEAVSDSQLASYGIDGSNELSSPGIQLRWGIIDGHGYVWNGMTRQVFALGELQMKRLKILAGRLDKDQVLDVDAIERLSIQQDLFTTTMVRTNPVHWQDSIRRERPITDSRVWDLVQLLRDIRLQEFTRTPPTASPDIGVVRIGEKGLLDADHTVRIWHTPGGALVQVDALPVQFQGEQAASSWNRLITALGHDYLFDLRNTFTKKALSEVIITRSQTDHFRLEKHGMRDVINGLSQWDVVWPNGREIARSDGAAAIAHALDQLVVTDLHKRGDDKLPADALDIDFVFQVDASHLHAIIAGAPGAWTLWSDTHVAKVTQLPAELTQLTPASMFDPGLVNRPAQQVTKVQRIIADAGILPSQASQLREAYALGDDHVWRQSFPSDQSSRAVDANALDRLIRAICVARARSVRFITAEDRAVLTAPDFELDLRFSQLEDQPSGEASRMDETTSQDLGFCFKREGEQHWRAVDKEGSVSYQIDSELVELLLSPVSDTLVLPLVPSLVSRIYVLTLKERFELDQAPADGGWVALLYDAQGKLGPPQKADPIQVRRLLRALANVRASKIDIHAPPLPVGEAEAVIRCTLPGKESERQTLTIGKRAAPTDDWVLSAESDNSINGHGPSGRCYLPPSATPMITQMIPTYASMLAIPEPPAKR